MVPPSLGYKFCLLLEYFEDSTLQIKKELLLFLEVWALYIDTPKLHAKKRKILAKLPALNRELKEYTVLANIKRKEVRTFLPVS